MTTPEKIANFAKCRACQYASGSHCAKGGTMLSNAYFVGCPAGYFPAPKQDGTPAVATAGPEVWGPPLWRELHTEKNITPEWLAGWLARIPAYGCACRSDIAEIAKMYPMDFSTPEASFEVGWRWHCLVSTKIGNPVISLAAARRIHGR